MKSSIRKRKRFYFFTAVALIALLLLGYGAWGLWRRYRATHTPNPVISTKTIVHSTSEPDETPPIDACKNYHVPPNEPQKIEIAGMGVSGCIQKVGIDQHKQIAVPSNIHLAGWYVKSALPGEKGVSVVDGHVLGHYNDAIFGKLADVKPDDTVRIQRGDNSWLTFKVVDVHSYPVNQVMDHLFQPLQNVDQQLTLITCTGVYDPHSQTYDQRVIVRSKLL